MARFRPSHLSYAPAGYGGVLDMVLPSALTLPVRVGRAAAGAGEAIGQYATGAKEAAQSFFSSLSSGLSTAAGTAAQTYALAQEAQRRQQEEEAAARARTLWTVGAVVAVGVGLWAVSRALAPPAPRAAPAPPPGGSHA